MKNILCNFSSVLLLSFFISCYTGISNETAPNYPIRVNCKEFGLPIKFINQKSLYYKPKDGTLIETIKKCKSEIHIPLIISTIGLASFYLYAKNGNVDHFDECENKLLSNNNRLYFVGLNSKNQKIETDYYLATNAKSINNEKDYNLYMNLKSNYCQEESVDNEIIKSPYHNFLQIVNKIKELEKELTIYINTHEKILKSKSELEQKLNDLKIDLANLEIHTFTIIGKIIKKDQNGILAEGWAFPDKDLQERPELLSIDGANPAFVNPKKTMLIRKYDEENIIYTHSGKEIQGNGYYYHGGTSGIKTYSLEVRKSNSKNDNKISKLKIEIDKKQIVLGEISRIENEIRRLNSEIYELKKRINYK